jgi:diaminopimelate epimerase
VSSAAATTPVAWAPGQSGESSGGRPHQLLHFVKVHGAGNDFVLVPDPDGALHLEPSLVRALCDRHLGIGGDGLIRVAPPRDPAAADVFMDYRNADGSVAEMCGNGVRCVAKYVVDRALVVPDPATGIVLVDTRAGVKPVVVTARDDAGLVTHARVDMGAPVPGDVGLPIDVDGEKVTVTTLSMGNPHAVVVVEDLAKAPVAALGTRLQTHPSFPDGVNVEFIRVPQPDRVEGRIFERGVGETMASGSGASAMAVAAHLGGLTGRHVVVAVPGGELEIDWTDETLFVTGPAAEVAEGDVDEAWLRAIH